MPKVVVTGGGGFLGRAICRRLLSEGHQVTSIARSDYPELRALGVQTVRADLSNDIEALRKAFQSAQVVFHTAAKVEMWGDAREFERHNIDGTDNVINACTDVHVKHLVFTSSPSVVAGAGELKNVNESTPYPHSYLAHYPRTKAIAESHVLKANSADLFTISLRPHLIFGPNDTSLIQTVLKKARQGALAKIGSGKNIVDFSFIDDCVSAHIAAWRALESNPNSRGKAYFISQDEPVELWWWINEVLARSGMAPVTKSIPFQLAYALAWISERAASILKREPRLTRFLVHEMATDHYFDITAGKRDLGYLPQFSMTEALDRTFSPDIASVISP